MNATTTKENFKQIENTENSHKCVMDYDHSNQKTYRTSAPIWTTVPAMEKIQAKYGINAETVNQNTAFILLAKKAGVDITLNDLDRNKKALEPTTPIEAKPDTNDLNLNSDLIAYISKHIKNKVTYKDIATLKALREAPTTPIEAKPDTNDLNLNSDLIAYISKHIKNKVTYKDIESNLVKSLINLKATDLKLYKIKLQLISDNINYVMQQENLKELSADIPTF